MKKSIQRFINYSLNLNIGATSDIKEYCIINMQTKVVTYDWYRFLSYSYIHRYPFKNPASHKK